MDDIQIISDLHMEFTPYEFPRIPVKSKYIALCGDIGIPTMTNYIQLVSYLSGKFTRVFIVYGNHEYYSDTNDMNFIESFGEILVSKFNNVYLLNNSSIIVDGIKIIGSVLWSYISPRCHNYYSHRINNYHKIRIHNRKLSPYDTNLLNRECVQFLDREIKSSKYPVLVLTHYAPLPINKKGSIFLYPNTISPLYSIESRYINNECIKKSHSDFPISRKVYKPPIDTSLDPESYKSISHYPVPKDQMETVNGHCKGVSMAYYNDLSFLLSPKIIAWCFGHTHERYNFNYMGILFLSNPKGYKDEIKDSYDHGCIINLR